MTKVKTSKQAIFYIIIIIIIGAIFRFYNFENRVILLEDTGRDLLAGYLIAYENQTPELGHWNSGLSIEYPPYYYYIISYIVGMSPKILFVFGFLTALHLFGIIIIYLTARELLSQKSSIATSFIYAVSPFAIQISHLYLSVYFGFIVFLPTILFYIKFLKNKKKINLILLSFFLALTSTIYYGAVLFFPIYFIYLFYNLLKEKRGTLKILKILSIFSFSFFFFLLLANYPLLKNEYFSYLFGFKQKENMIDININLAKINKIFEYVFHGMTYLKNNFMLLIIFISFLINTKKNRIFASLFFTALVFHIFLMIIKTNPLPHYIAYVFPLFILGIGEIIDNIKNEKFLIKILFIFSLFFIITSFRHTFYHLNINRSEYKTVTLFSKHLREKYALQSFSVTEEFEEKGWFNKWFWYKNRDYLTFNISAANNYQIDLKNKHKELHVCKINSSRNIKQTSTNFCSRLAIKNNLIYLEKIDYEQVSFLIYKETTCFVN